MASFKSSKTLMVLFVATLVAGTCVGLAAPWMPYGPNGGDARAFAIDPKDHTHLYLGAVNGWIYESKNIGATWKRLARVGNRDDLVLDSIVVDAANPKHVMVGAWTLGGNPDGGFFQSSDGGATWTSQKEMKGESIRALVAAPSDPKILVAGTLKGVYRSVDSGRHFELISPPENKEIHEVESVAIDPLDPRIIYAGTWHLPWKTTDGGYHWANIKQGVIDDSDVFSIIVDPKNPKVVFASACSGIYKSEDAGGKFAKVQGIPSTARRTRVLMQDPEHQETVFAGTTEGLYRTDDAGKTWARTTGPELIVNDVSIDPTNSKHVLLATDRGGVLTSEDGGNSFKATNAGYSSRQVRSFVSDAQRPGTIYAGVVNDKEWGGVFISRDGGLNWAQQSAGLSGRDVFSLGQAPDGTIVAGTGRGIYYFQDATWTRAGDVPLPPRAAPAARRGGAKRVAQMKAAPVAPVGSHAAPAKSAAVSAKGFDGAVYAFATVGDRVYAGTSQGLLSSTDQGRLWQPVGALGQQDWRFVAAAQRTIVASSLGSMMVSTDGGETWAAATLPANVSQVSAVAVDDRGELWAGGREGVYFSTDNGASWQSLVNLFVRNVDNLYFDAHTSQVLVTAEGQATIAFAVNTATRKVSYWDTGWNLRFVRPVGDHLLGATLFDGVVIQPRMVETKQMAKQ